MAEASTPPDNQPKVPAWLTSWKTWASIAGAIVVTIAVIERTRPYIEIFSTKSIRAEVKELKEELHQMKHNHEARFDRIDNKMGGSSAEPRRTSRDHGEHNDG